jgi:hypothetical protein
MNNIEVDILGVGVWGSAVRNWNDLQSVFDGQQLQDDGSKGPKPEVIPANERRRAPLPVRLAIEASWQACQQSGFDPAQLSSVFVSGLGDTQLTDYMCRALIGENKALSPTKFHNSVHNAAAGYWTISTGCMRSANSVAGNEKSMPLALLEALIESQAHTKPMLISFYDAPCSDVLQELLKNQQAFSAAIVISPKGFQHDKPVIGTVRAQVLGESATWPTFACDPLLLEGYQTNPAARILPLLKMICSADRTINTIQMPLSSGTSLKLSLATT